MIEPTRIMKNIIPVMIKGPKMPPIINNRNKEAKIPTIHLAHVLGHFAVWDSGLENRMAIIDKMNMPGAIIIIAAFSSAAPMNIIVPATNGEVTRAIAGYFHPRYR